MKGRERGRGETDRVFGRNGERAAERLMEQVLRVRPGELANRGEVLLVAELAGEAHREVGRMLARATFPFGTLNVG